MKLDTCHEDSCGGAASFVEEAWTPYGPFGRTPGRTAPSGSAPARNVPTAAVSPCDLPGIRKAMQTIRLEYSRPLTVTMLARECGMSVRSLHRLYRTATGRTIGRDLTERRLEAAAELLREHGDKLEPVAMETGLRNAKNLCRLFKEHLGVTPGQWKQASRGIDAGAA